MSNAVGHSNAKKMNPVGALRKIELALNMMTVSARAAF